MCTRLSAPTLTAIALALASLIAGCEAKAPVAPAPAPPKPPNMNPLAAAPTVSGISPTSGSPDGGVYATLTGTGFHPGATVTFGDAVTRAGFTNGTGISVAVPPHALGTVAIVVTNGDGQSATLPGGFTYAPRGSFDFNGSWETSVYIPGDPDHGSYDLVFTIENDVLVSLSCGPTSLTFSRPTAVSDGEFSHSENGRLLMSGRIASSSAARGTIAVAPCTDNWYAIKR